MSAMMVDAAYYDLYKAMKPGMRENEAVALVAETVATTSGSEYVEGVNAISGERCSPHPHRLLRSRHCGQATRSTTTSCIRHGVSHLLLPHVRDRLGVARTRRRLQAVPRLPGCVDRADSARAGSRRRSSSVWPKAQEFGFPNEEAAFALQMGHGIGLAIWEKPMISRLVSLEHPHEIKPGMVFALETFWPSTDGWSAARIEEEIVVTQTGHEVITRFPAEQLLVAGAPFVTVGGTLPIDPRDRSAAQSARWSR